MSYADDMALLTPSIAALNELLSVKDTVSHGVLYNIITKTVYMVFQATGKKSPDLTLPVLLNGALISKVSQIKYLGRCLVDSLKDDVLYI